MRVILQALAPAVLAAFAVPAAAQDTAANVKICTNNGPFSPADRVTACTALIESGAVAPGSLALVLLDRGGAYSAQKDYDRAIADYSEAIRLNPQLENALYDRGEAYRLEKNYARAIGDYDQAIQIDPKDADALYGRGLARKALGRQAEGEADMARARSIDPNIARQFGG